MSGHAHIENEKKLLQTFKYEYILYYLLLPKIW